MQQRLYGLGSLKYLIYSPLQKKTAALEYAEGYDLSSEATAHTSRSSPFANVFEPSELAHGKTFLIFSKLSEIVTVVPFLKMRKLRHRKVKNKPSDPS